MIYGELGWPGGGVLLRADTRRHIRAALKFGASMEKVMDLLELCVCSGSRRNVGRCGMLFA